jgi:hypothetical protein
MRSGFFLLISSLCFSGCSSYFWRAPMNWMFVKQLAEADPNGPHGKLKLQSDSNALILIDDRAPSSAGEDKNIGVTRRTFFLRPGRHTIQVRYSFQGSSRNYHSDILRSEFDIHELKDTYIWIYALGNKLTLSAPIIFSSEQDLKRSIEESKDSLTQLPWESEGDYHRRLMNVRIPK